MNEATEEILKAMVGTKGYAEIEKIAAIHDDKDPYCMACGLLWCALNEYKKRAVEIIYPPPEVK